MLNNDIIVTAFYKVNILLDNLEQIMTSLVVRTGPRTEGRLQVEYEVTH